MPKQPVVRKEDVATWSRPVRQALDAIATTMSALLFLVRARAADHLSPLIRAFADRDAIFLDRELLRREVALLRARIESLAPQQRPHYRPEARLAILQLMRLRHWTVEHTADRLAVHANTVRHWLKEFNFSPEAPLFTGAAPFNKLSEAATWLVHEIRALCPEPEFGTRQIAARIVRAGVKLSRSSVQWDRACKRRRFRARRRPQSGALSFHGLLSRTSITRESTSSSTLNLTISDCVELPI
jgi:hypothetical protein